MFRRVRSKLIFWLLLVTLGTMVPVALVPYFSLRTQSLKDGKQRLDLVRQDFVDLGEQTRRILEPAAKVVHESLRTQLGEDPSLKQAFREGDSAVLDGLARRLTDNLHKVRYCGAMQVYLLSTKEYDQLDELRTSGQSDLGLYETKSGTLLLWVYSGLTVDEVTIGGFVVGQPIMHRQSSTSIAGGLTTSSLFVPDWIPRSPRGVQIDVVDPASPSILESEFVTSKPFQELLQGIRTHLDTSSVKINGYLSQASFNRFNNQRGKLTGIIVLSVPRLEPIWTFISTYALRGIVFAIFFAVIVGAVVARSIAHPLNRLTRTARQMARGDFSARVNVTSKDEVGQLATSFNEMASQVERSHTELAVRAQELEDSIRLLNATNRELTRTQSRLENILANIRSGVIVIDNVGRVIRANRAGQEILGLAEQPDADYREILGYEEFGQLVESSLHKGISVFQREIAWNDNGKSSSPLQVSAVPLLDDGRITGLVVTFHDLSNIRNLERQLVLQDRLAALGRLSAGVAHEIRNPLGVIKGSAELLRKRFGGQPGEEGLLDFILEEVARLSRVVSDFLNFARPPVPELEQVDVNSVIQRSLQYLQHQNHSHKIVQEFDLAHNLPSLWLDPNLFQQVLLNILLNAQEAMSNGGTIRVRTRRFSSREVAVEVEDSGVGIASDDLQHIFDPFFTSKDGGTGLGLSLVHQIVSSHSGRIEVNSQEGKGTTFRLIFPIHSKDSPQPWASTLSE